MELAAGPWSGYRRESGELARRKLRFGLVNAILVPHWLSLLAVADLAIVTLRMRASTDKLNEEVR